MTPQPRANEIPELVSRLGSRSRTDVLAARARLSIFGSRAVEALIDALEDDARKPVRTNAMRLLALIGDPRGRQPLIAMLLDRQPHMREVAARCLARFPGEESASALVRLLRTEGRTPIRVAAIHSLVELYDAGQECALRRILDALYDEEEKVAVRLAAMSLLPRLPARQRRGIVQHLLLDPEEKIAAQARAIERGRARRKARGSRPIKKLLKDLRSADYEVWDRAVRRLGRCGAPAVEPLIAEMRRRSGDPEYCSRAGMALKALGPVRARRIGDALEEVHEPVPLQVIVEVIGALGEKSMIYRLKDLIDRLAARSDDDGGVPALESIDPMQRVRAKAHLELARIGSRVAVHDLNEALSDGKRKLDLELLAAVELIGKKEEVLELLRAWRREDGFMRERIGRAVRTILRRERIRRDTPIFRTLAPAQRLALDRILPSRTPRARPRTARRKRSASH